MSTIFLLVYIVIIIGSCQCQSTGQTVTIISTRESSLTQAENILKKMMDCNEEKETLWTRLIHDKNFNFKEKCCFEKSLVIELNTLIRTALEAEENEMEIENETQPETDTETENSSSMPKDDVNSSNSGLDGVVEELHGQIHFLAHDVKRKEEIIESLTEVNMKLVEQLELAKNDVTNFQTNCTSYAKNSRRLEDVQNILWRNSTRLNQVQNSLENPERNLDLELYMALNETNERTLRNLIQSGANLNKKYPKGFRNWEYPLHIVSTATNMESKLNLIKYLIDNDANPFLRDRHNYTFLHTLLSWRKPPTPTEFHNLVEFLIVKNLTELFNCQDDHLRTPLMKSVQNMEVDSTTLQLLYLNGADFNLGDETNNTALFYSILGSRSSRLLMDLTRFCHLRHLNKDGWNLLHYTAHYGNVEMLGFVLRFGFDVNSKDGFFEETPLHHATYRMQVLRKVRLLIENGADKTVKDNRGKTPLDVARENKARFLSDSEEVFRLLEI